jgi:low affinity Fe/Cu permease
MFIGLLILIRVMFVASMVFIIGYVFGSFSKNTTLTVITNIAAILVIVLFIIANIFAFRFTARGWRYNGMQYDCGYDNSDSTSKK